MEKYQNEPYNVGHDGLGGGARHLRCVNIRQTRQEVGRGTSPDDE